MKIQKLFLSLCLFLSIIIPTIAQPVSPGTYTITNKNSNLCLAIRGATSNNGEEGTQWTCDGNADKNWKIIDAGNGYFKIQNRNSSLFLAVGAGSRDYGGRCIQYADEGQQDILWGFIDIGLGYYKIQNKNSGLFLAIGGGSRESGADLIQWGDTGQEDIKWQLFSQEKRIISIKLLGVSSDIHNGDCKRGYGTVNVTLWEIDDRGNRVNKVRRLMMPGRSGEGNLLDWEKGPVRNINNFPVNGFLPNVEDKIATFSANYSLIKMNRIILVVKTNLGTAHKGCDLCSDFTWDAKMPAEKEQVFYIRDVWNSAEVVRTEIDNSVVKSVVVGPYPTIDNRHKVAVHFEVQF